MLKQTQRTKRFGKTGTIGRWRTITRTCGNQNITNQGRNLIL